MEERSRPDGTKARGEGESSPRRPGALKRRVAELERPTRSSDQRRLFAPHPSDRWPDRHLGSGLNGSDPGPLRVG